MPPKGHVHHVVHDQFNVWPNFILNSVADMQKTGQLCDLTITAKDGSVMVHSNILASVSSLVSATTQNGNNNRIIQMPPNISYNALMHLVQYAYHGECHVSSDQLKEFAALAQHLQMDQLFNYCKRHVPSLRQPTVTRSKAKRAKVSNEETQEFDEEDRSQVVSLNTNEPDEIEGEHTVRKSTRNRKTSLRLIEAISDSRPQFRLKRKLETSPSPTKSPNAKRKTEHLCSIIKPDTEVEELADTVKVKITSEDKDVKPNKAEKDSKHNKAEKDVKPNKTVKDFKSKQTGKDAKPNKIEKDTKPTKEEKDANPNKTEKDVKLKQTEKDAKPNKIEKDIKPNKEEKDVKPNKTEKDANPKLTEKDAKPNKIEKDVKPNKTEKDPKPKKNLVSKTDSQGLDNQAKKVVRKAKKQKSVNLTHVGNRKRKRAVNLAAEWTGQLSVSSEGDKNAPEKNDIPSHLTMCVDPQSVSNDDDTATTGKKKNASTTPTGKKTGPLSSFETVLSSDGDKVITENVDVLPRLNNNVETDIDGEKETQSCSNASTQSKLKAENTNELRVVDLKQHVDTVPKALPETVNNKPKTNSSDVKTELSVLPTSKSPIKHNTKRKSKEFCERHKCRHCKKNFKMRIGLEKHVFTVHTDIRPHQCDKCNMSFSSKKDWRNHLRDHSLAEKDGSVVKNVHFKGYLCFICRKYFPKGNELDSHKESCKPNYAFGLDPDESGQDSTKYLDDKSQGIQTIELQAIPSCESSSKPETMPTETKKITDMQSLSTSHCDSNEPECTSTPNDQTKVAVSSTPEKQNLEKTVKTEKKSQVKTVPMAVKKLGVESNVSVESPVLPDEGIVSSSAIIESSNQESEQGLQPTPLPDTPVDTPSDNLQKLYVVGEDSVSSPAPEKFNIPDDDAYYDRYAEKSKDIKIIAGRNYDEIGDKYVCNVCKSEFQNKHAIERHMYCSHSNPRPYGCAKCNLPFSLKADCARHLHDHSLAESEGLKEVNNVHFKGYICMRCLQNFQLPSGLDNHKRTCRKEPKVCIYCGKGFKKCISLKRHIAEMHEGDQELCPICEKMVSNINAHKRMHTDKRYICPTCAKVFNRADNLRVHQRIHSGERPFLCAICGEKFRLKCLLKSHMKHHKRKLSQDTTIVFRVHDEANRLISEGPDSADSFLPSDQITKRITADLVPTSMLTTGTSPAKSAKGKRVRRQKPAGDKSLRNDLSPVSADIQGPPMNQVKNNQAVIPCNGSVPQGLPPLACPVSSSSNNIGVAEPNHHTYNSCSSYGHYFTSQNASHGGFSKIIPEPVIEHSAAVDPQPHLNEKGQSGTVLPQISHILSPQRSHPHLLQSLTSSPMPMNLHSPMMPPSGQNNSTATCATPMTMQDSTQNELSQFNIPLYTDPQTVDSCTDFAPMRSVDFAPIAQSYNQHANSSNQYEYNANNEFQMSIEESHQIQNYIGQPVAKQVVLEPDHAATNAQNSQANDVPQSGTYLAL